MLDGWEGYEEGRGEDRSDGGSAGEGMRKGGRGMRSVRKMWVRERGRVVDRGWQSGFIKLSDGEGKGDEGRRGKRKGKGRKSGQP